MKMKNVFMLLLGAMLVLSMAGAVSAVEITQEDFSGNIEKSSQVTVSLYLSQTFSVEIPADFQLEPIEENGVWRYSSLQIVNTTIHLLGPGKYLNITISSINYTGNAQKDWKLTEVGGSSSYNYTVKGSQYDNTHVDYDHDSASMWLSSGDVVLRTNRVGDDYRYLHFRLRDAPTSVGTYVDTLTFTVKID